MGLCGGAWKNKTRTMRPGGKAEQRARDTDKAISRRRWGSSRPSQSRWGRFVKDRIFQVYIQRMIILQQEIRDCRFTFPGHDATSSNQSSSRKTGCKNYTRGGEGVVATTLLTLHQKLRKIFCIETSFPCIKEVGRNTKSLPRRSSDHSSLPLTQGAVCPL